MIVDDQAKCAEDKNAFSQVLEEADQIELLASGI